MKTLVIFGSPRQKGQTKKMVNILLENLDGEVEIVDCYKENVKPCVDCRACFKKKACAISDKMQEIYKKIDAADNIVLAAPVYFFGVPAPMKAVMDRCQIYWASVVRGDTPTSTTKKGAILLTGGAFSFENQFLGAELALKILLKDFSAECLDMITFANTDKQNVENDQQTIEQINNLALKLNDFKKSAK